MFREPLWVQPDVSMFMITEYGISMNDKVIGSYDYEDGHEEKDFHFT